MPNDDLPFKHLPFKIIATCSTTNARVSELSLSSTTLHLPIFMPVATYAAMRSIKTTLLKEEIILSNTYHLRKLGKNVKKFMQWKGGLLTDSGGFQIQSLPNEVTEEGVWFTGLAMGGAGAGASAARDEASASVASETGSSGARSSSSAARDSADPSGASTADSASASTSSSAASETGSSASAARQADSAERQADSAASYADPSDSAPPTTPTPSPTRTLFRPEDSMQIQMTLGADIFMQLDDVVNPSVCKERHEEAVRRSLSWLDRAIAELGRSDNASSSVASVVNEVNGQGYERTARSSASAARESASSSAASRADSSAASDSASASRADLSTADSTSAAPDDSHPPSGETPKRRLTTSKHPPTTPTTPTTPTPKHLLFPIIQGGLHLDLRSASINGILARHPPGVAIGGLSGGEDKTEFCRTVFHCCTQLPSHLPRYLMGVGYPEDIVVCCALGTDMSDCVYPTRTARFGRAFTDDGDLHVDQKVSTELVPLSLDCTCPTCLRYSRAYLFSIRGSQNFCTLLSMHNLFYMRGLTNRIREAIMKDEYPIFIKEFMKRRFPGGVPEWVISGLGLVGVSI